ncbi:chromate efflux transporter [Pelagibius litoralis]|uniref:Chromate efflux transporter n=1 Tax=Pelagibius litoralis TaxID=374515 RepID=A0A967C8J9_9PROT|nr:chromate efflux transporter [Pelagibius litoralis]NIA68452.1 chromate efflux transporter [Pelagibius litoralis]
MTAPPDSSTPEDKTAASGPRRGGAGEVFAAFAKLGFTSFGGPIAHLGYFREEFVVRRRWIDERGYADLVALCQFLPGPASSQVGFGLGLLRGGPLGALAAWVAFTLPSALALILFAFGAASFDGPIADGILQGLKLVAVAVVAQALWGMARSLCPDRERASIALAAVLVVVFLGGAFGQVSAIGLGGLAGLWVCRNAAVTAAQPAPFPVGRRVGIAALLGFFVLLFGLPVLAITVAAPELAVFDSFYRAGALVFGGGHVVLPLLQAEVVPPGWVGEDAFLAGYGAAQAVPGPLFTFAAYLGAVMTPYPGGLLAAGIALVAVFLPGFLLLIGALPFWNLLRARPSAQAALQGTNAAVVGILGAALYDPIWTSAVRSAPDFALALTGFLLLTLWKTPPWLVVILMAAGGVALTVF